MTTSISLQKDIKPTITAHQQSPLSKMERFQENFKLAIGAVAAIIVGIVMLAVFSNPYLIILGAILFTAGLVASHQIWWSQLDSKLDSMRKCDCSSTNQIGLDLGTI